MSNYSPNVNNYQVAKGVLYFDRYDDNGDLTGELDLGNDPSFALSPNIENLEHFSSRDGIKRKDKVAVIQASVNGKFTLDEINYDNLALIFMGGDTSYFTQTGATVTNEAITAHVGKHVKLQYRKLTDGTVVITDSTGMTTYIEDTDYSVDYTTGRIKAIVGGNITEGEDLFVDYTYESCSYPVVNIADSPEITGLLRFKGDCTLGYDFEIVLWKIKLTPTGDVNFISEGWNQVEFNFEGLDDTANHPTSPWGQIIDIEGDTVVVS